MYFLLHRISGTFGVVPRFRSLPICPPVDSFIHMQRPSTSSYFRTANVTEIARHSNEKKTEQFSRVKVQEVRSEAKKYDVTRCPSASALPIIR